MKLKLRMTTVFAGLLALGLVGGPALAQEGFAPGACADDVALVAPEGYTVDDLPDDLSPEELCTIYGVGVIDVGEEEPDDVTGEKTEVLVSTESVEPPQVLGTALARTGVDATLLAVFAVALLGLGVVAVRRSGRGNADA